MSEAWQDTTAGIGPCDGVVAGIDSATGLVPVMPGIVVARCGKCLHSLALYNEPSPAKCLHCGYVLSSSDGVTLAMFLGDLVEDLCTIVTMLQRVSLCRRSWLTLISWPSSVSPCSPRAVSQRTRT